MTKTNMTNMTKTRVSSKISLAAFLCLFIITQTQFQVSHSLSCLSCSEYTCPTLDCVGGTHIDACGCCPTCAKQNRERCGGPFLIAGQCDTNLTCVVRPNHRTLHMENEFGTCKPADSLASSNKCRETHHFGCNLFRRRCACGRKVACTNPFRFKSYTQCNRHKASISNSRHKCRSVQCNVQRSEEDCPGDSVSVEGYVPPGECCPEPSLCKCMTERCINQLCAPNTQRVLISEGDSTPGSCCDEYRCISREDEDECATVECSSSLMTCPSDSTAVNNPFPQNKCCPGKQICQCLKHQCVPPPTCSEDQSLKIAYRGNGKPGSCCDEYICTKDVVFTGCSVNGTQYEHGSTYRKGACTMCDCKLGLSYCGPLDCPDLSTCTRITKSENECCPTCLDGVDKDYSPSILPQHLCRGDDNLLAYAVGETWSPDPCTYCTCEEGGITRCTAAFCHEPAVATFKPECESFSDCPLTDVECHNGFEHDDQGCRTCRCKPDHDLCPPMNGCDLRCPRGYVPDQSGCDTCQCKARKCKDLTSCRKQCPFGYKSNKKGCDRCRCRRCPSMESCKKDCSFGLTQNRYGCAVCKCRASHVIDVSARPPSQSCIDELTGRRHDDGESWSSDCSICMCLGGDVMCDIMKCPLPACDVPVFEDGACCATCPDDPSEFPIIPPSVSCQEHDSDWFVEGDTWEINQCTKCTCHSGLVMCTSKHCPPAPCENPVYDERLCCPKCLDVLNPLSLKPKSKQCQDHNGTMHNNGKVLRVDVCTTAICLDGDIKRFTTKCPKDLPCQNPVVRIGRCCPECLDAPPSFRGCVDDGENKTHAEQWNKTSSPCTKCACIDGAVRCRFPECPPIPSKCWRVHQPPGACCKECILEETDFPFVTVPHSNKKSGDWVTPALIIILSCLCAGLILIVVYVKVRCSSVIHSKQTYSPGTTHSSSEQKQAMVTCSSMNIGGEETARTSTVSTPSEEKTLLGMQ